MKAGGRPTVSVVISTYNRPHFLRQALDSVYRQTFSDYEIIVVDDGSGPEVTQTYQLREDTRLICHEVPKRGCAATKNTGTRASLGKYVAYLDDDDTWREDKLEKQVCVLEEHSEVALVYSYFTLVDEALNPLPDQPRPKAVPRDFFRRFAVGNYIKSPSLVMMRREAFDQCVGFNETAGGAEDWDMWARIAHKYPLHCVQEPLVNYRVHGSQLTGKYLLSRRADVAMMASLLQWVKQEAPEARMLYSMALSYRLQRLSRWEATENGLAAGMRTVMRAIAACPADPRAYLRIPLVAWLGLGHALRRQRPARQ